MCAFCLSVIISQLYKAEETFKKKQRLRKDDIIVYMEYIRESTNKY